MTDNELNALVAERVMERQVYRGKVPYDKLTLIVPGSWGGVPGYGMQPTLENCPDYANDIAAAFDAFTEASKIKLMQLYYTDADKVWRVLFPRERFTVSGKSPSKVMSFAALEAVGVEVEG